MRLGLDLFADHVLAIGQDVCLPLWCGRLSWHCADGLLNLRVIACEAMALPDVEPSEPVSGAIARLAQHLAGQGALMLLEHPANSFGPERIAFAEGVRLLDIRQDADVACWDAGLTLGLPLYGVRGELVVDVLNPHPASVLSSLAYGLFFCREVPQPSQGQLDAISLDERRDGLRLELDRSADITVVVRGGFEAEQHAGNVFERADQGGEGYVRLHARSDSGQLWTQPRFIAPRHG